MGTTRRAIKTVQDELVELTKKWLQKGTLDNRPLTGVYSVDRQIVYEMHLGRTSVYLEFDKYYPAPGDFNWFKKRLRPQGFVVELIHSGIDSACYTLRWLNNIT
jgi:hypothetical protein